MTQRVFETYRNRKRAKCLPCIRSLQIEGSQQFIFDLTADMPKLWPLAAWFRSARRRDGCSIDVHFRCALTPMECGHSPTAAALDPQGLRSGFSCRPIRPLRPVSKLLTHGLRASRGVTRKRRELSAARKRERHPSGHNRCGFAIERSCWLGLLRLPVQPEFNILKANLVALRSPS